MLKGLNFKAEALSYVINHYMSYQSLSILNTTSQIVYHIMYILVFIAPGMVKVDQMVTGLAALQMTPQSTMQNAMKVIDDSFHWNDKPFNVS